MREVVITGLGCVTPNGNISRIDKSLWVNMLTGRSSIKPLTIEFNKDRIPVRVGSEMGPFNFKPIENQIPRLAKGIVKRPTPERTDLSMKIASAATLFACQMAGWDLEDTKRHPRIGVSSGSGLGGGRSWEEGLQHFLNGNYNRLMYTVSNVMNNSTAGFISEAFGFGGPSLGLTAACASSGYAIADAFYKITHNICDAVIAIGTETSLTPFQIACFNCIKALSRSDDSRASRPFSKLRDGFVMGEGAGALFLAEKSWALRHGMPILGLILNVATNNGATDVFDPSIEAATECMEQAIEFAGIQPHQIDYINTHGTSTPTGDKAETYAIANVFSDQAFVRKMPIPLINSSKALLGHTLGASGAIELVLTILSMQEGLVHPMTDQSLEDYCLDDLCVLPTKSADHKSNCFPLPFVVEKAVTRNINIAMSNAFGFGDHNVSIIVAQPDYKPEYR